MAGCPRCFFCKLEMTQLLALSMIVPSSDCRMYFLSKSVWSWAKYIHLFLVDPQTLSFSLWVCRVVRLHAVSLGLQLLFGVIILSSHLLHISDLTSEHSLSPQVIMLTELSWSSTYIYIFFLKPPKMHYY